MSAPDPTPTLDLREQIARIDNLIAQTQKAQADLGRSRIDYDKTAWEAFKISKDVKFQPWQIMTAGMTAGAALFAAGAAFIKILGG